EYAEILETTNDAGQLTKPDTVRLLDLSTTDLATLQEGLYARKSWLAQSGNEQIAMRLLKAAARGCVYCRANPDDCAQTATETGADRPAQHQKWVMNETNALIWPSPNGFGVIDPTAWDKTAQLAIAAGLIKAAPQADAVRTDLITQALSGLADLDT